MPIEEIVEFQFRIDIVPTPGLHPLLETDGFVTSDLSEIWVDQFVYDSRPSHYRFTLSHEIGHVVLHERILRAQSFSTLDAWKAFVNSIHVSPCQNAVEPPRRVVSQSVPPAGRP